MIALVTNQADRSGWEAAVAKYRSAGTALTNHPYGKALPTDRNYTALEADHANYVSAATGSLKAMLATPSPDCGALRDKLSIYTAEMGADEELASVFADVERFLDRNARSSTIMAMHQRYEAAMAEYLLAEKAERKAKNDGDDDSARSFERGMRALCRETDALRLAILNQVPDRWDEAMVLQFHITNAADLLVSSDGGPEAEQEALLTAIDTVFDFLCCERAEDHNALGREFQRAANRIFVARRHRTGQVED